MAMDDEYASGSDDESYAVDLTEQATDEEYYSSGSDGSSEASDDYSLSGCSDGDYIREIIGDATMCCSGRYGYAVLTEQDIRRQLRQQAAFTAEALSVPADWALPLLVHYRWREYDLIFDWDSDQDAVRHAVGLPAAGAGETPAPAKDETVTCGICLEARPAAATASVGCAHRYCHACWRGYVAAAAADGGVRCLALRCPDASCSRAVLRGTVERFATGAYVRALTRSFLDARGGAGDLKPCPAAGCGCAIKLVYVDGGVDVVCRCGTGFCWRCGGAPHWPASCAAAAQWARGDAEAASAAWLAVHAKPCPRCRRPVGRPDGVGVECCGTIVCAPPCAHRFCWRCLCDMADPNRPRISHYDCPEAYAAEQDEAERERARRALDGFLRHDDMWEASMAARRSAEREIRRLRGDGGGELEKFGLAWGVISTDVEFVVEAWEQVAEGRRVAGNVCLFARSMRGVVEEEEEDGDGRWRRDLLEFQLGQADDILGRLQRRVEKGPAAGKDLTEFSYEVRNLSSVARLFIGNFAKAVATGEVGGPASSGKSGTGSGTL
ncbi:unnamed protein product [Urochloa decumbens]|uniref:RBR-type E3 ubiquitin transferase n=1 Tax=Urochloa decumbens TaxID=240449 RepID=A0ABC9C9A1_9POAL